MKKCFSERFCTHYKKNLFIMHFMLQDSEAPLSFSSRTHFSRSYITVIDICILRQLSKTTSLAQGRRISLKCKLELEGKVASDLRVGDIHTVVLSQGKC